MDLTLRVRGPPHAEREVHYLLPFASVVSGYCFGRILGSIRGLQEDQAKTSEERSISFPGGPAFNESEPRGGPSGRAAPSPTGMRSSITVAVASFERPPPVTHGPAVSQWGRTCTRRASIAGRRYPPGRKAHDFPAALGRFIKVFPRDYRRVLEQSKIMQRQWELVNG